MNILKATFTVDILTVILQELEIRKCNRSDGRQTDGQKDKKVEIIVLIISSTLSLEFPQSIPLT